MALIIERPSVVFDLSLIGRGYLLWGRHSTWKEGKAGFVTSATEEQLTVQYYPGIGNVTNHFVVPVDEVSEGQWEIRWSTDMSEIQMYNLKADKEQQEVEGAEKNDSGGTDL